MEIEYFNERVVMSGFGDAARFYEGESRKSCMICRKNTENTSTTRMLFLRRIGYEVVDFGPLCGACLSGTRSVNLHCGARPANTALTGPTAVLEFTVRKTFRVIARIEYMGVFNSYKQALGVRHYGKKPNSMLMGMWVLTDLKVYTREPEGHLALVQQVDLYPYGTVGRRGEMETHARNIAEEFADEYAKAVVDDITRTD